MPAIPLDIMHNMVARGHWWAGLVLVILLVGAVNLGVPAIRGSILPIMSAGSTRLLITSAHPQRIRASLRYPVSRRNLQLALHTAMNKVGRLEHPGTLTIDRHDVVESPMRTQRRDPCDNSGTLGADTVGRIPTYVWVKP
jgi:hypothetical protein